MIVHLESQLILTLQLDEEDRRLAKELLPLCEEKVGRLLCNGWARSVEVCHAMVQGGPVYAISDGRSTSVGSLAMEPFIRPIGYRDVPATLPPPNLHNKSGAQKLLSG